MLRGVDYLSNIAAEAIAAIKLNRLRSILSILGISIGIMAVMAVSTVSRGGRVIIFSELETFGLRSVWVTRDYEDKDPQRAVRLGTGISNEDIAQLQATCCPSVRRITPIISHPQQRFSARAEGKYSRPTMYGVGADYLAINNDTLEEGRPIHVGDEKRSRKVVLIGSDIKRELFGDGRSAVGKDLRLGEERMQVIGVIAPKDRSFLSSIGSAGENANTRVLMPYTTYQRIFDTKDVSLIQAEAIGVADAKAAVDEVIAFLKRRNGDRYAYRGDTMAQYIATANRILQGVSIIGIVAASVSLFVGGMAIMNIMSTAVLERTREIGLRKAIGASYADILLQFLLEAVTLSISGGIVGLVFGASVSYLLSLLTGFPLNPSLWSLGVAFFVSVFVGVASGFYPAHRAASVHPVVALRYE